MGNSFDFFSSEKYPNRLKNQAGSVLVLEQLYMVSQNGKLVQESAEHFRLHDSALSFKQQPRVFTTFVAQPVDTTAPAQEGHASSITGRCEFAVVGLERHLARLSADARSFEIPIPQLPLRDIGKLNNPNAPDQPKRVRIIFGKAGLELFVDTFERRFPAGQGISVCLFEGERAYPESKTTLTEVSLRAHERARALDCEEALLVDSTGHIREGAWTSLFWVDSAGQLRQSGEAALPGVTAALISGFRRAEVTKVTPSELLAAKEIFLTQSTHGVIPVRLLEGNRIGDGGLGPVTRMVSAWYQSLSQAKENRIT
jgi:branched-subunit amino acid aminotransferase/4-amino-4-deoxychorismate lyase